MATRGLSTFLGSLTVGLLWVAVFFEPLAASDRDRALSPRWDHELLTIRGDHIPGKALEVWYLETFCRTGATTGDWTEAVIPHTSARVAASPDGQLIKLQSRLSDGVRVDFDQDRPTSTKHIAPPAKKLIEFGWDEPDTGFLRQQRAQLEQTPFDGCVFHVTTKGAGGTAENFAWLCWGRRRFTEAELEPAIADLASIKSNLFRHNFLRFNVTPADIDWFDDHDSVVSNARLAARMAFSGACQGILLDTEAYQGKLFDYHSQRDASRRSWAEYAAQSRLRGREVMSAFQQAFPNLTVLVTFGHSLAWKESDGGKKPLADCRDGLLVPFLDGMIDAVTGKTRLVDGHELSYGFGEPGLFVQARETIRVKAAGLAADPLKYRSVVSAGFGLWLDYDRLKNGWKTDKVESNYFSPERFESSLRAAVEQADEYVWIYTEKPRWWSVGGKAIDLPPAYIEAVSRVRRGLLDD